MSRSSEKLAASSIGRKYGISLGIDTAEQRNPPLGPVQHLVGLSQQSHAFLVTCQGLVETDLPLFQQVNNLLQPAERLLETRRVGCCSWGFSEILPTGGVAIMFAPGGRYFAFFPA